MSRTWRRLVGGVVPDGKVLRHVGRGRVPRATRSCFDDPNCEWCNSVDKRRRIPAMIELSQMEDYNYA